MLVVQANKANPRACPGKMPISVSALALLVVRNGKLWGRRQHGNASLDSIDRSACKRALECEESERVESERERREAY